MLHWLSKILLFPVSVLFGLVVRLRYWLYRHHFLGSTEFDIPVICVGNLNVGGSGKTPMIEWLIRLFQAKYPVGIVSRGYGRSTQGFLRLHPRHLASQAGDEPLQLKLKYPATEVAVGEARVIAIPRLLSLAPQLKVILMDDGYQHLSVRPQLNILLTSYQKPFWEDQLLPLGSLREPVEAKSRAHIIIVTKCPADLTETDKQHMLDQIRPGPAQKVYFSTLRYGRPYPLFGAQTDVTAPAPQILLTGIADAKPLTEHFAKYEGCMHFEFGDHHVYTEHELYNILRRHPDQRNWYTTEKDAVRLIPFQPWFINNQIRLWVQPAEMSLLPGQDESLDMLLLRYLSFYYPEPVENAPDANAAE